MFSIGKNLVAGAALLGLSLASLTSPALAGVENYEFQVIQSPQLKVNDPVVSVRLIDKKTGKPVPDAVIFAKRIDMAPDNMENMIMPIEQLPSTEPGVYRFQTQLVMAGNWRLSLGAKIQNETDSLESKIVFKVLP